MITYNRYHNLARAAFEADLIPWSDPALTSVCTNGYIQKESNWDKSYVINLLNRLKRYQKPVFLCL